MKETGNSPVDIPPDDRRGRYFREHPFAGQPLLRRVIAWKIHSGLEKPFSSREPIQIKKVA